MRRAHQGTDPRSTRNSGPSPQPARAPRPDRRDTGRSTGRPHRPLGRPSASARCPPPAGARATAQAPGRTGSGDNPSPPAKRNTDRQPPAKAPQPPAPRRSSSDSNSQATSSDPRLSGPRTPTLKLNDHTRPVRRQRPRDPRQQRIAHNEPPHRTTDNSAEKAPSDQRGYADQNHPNPARSATRPLRLGITVKAA